MSKITIEEGLKQNGFHISSVEGDSMMPLLRQGIDMVKVVPVEGKLKKYDLPLYKRPNGKYVLHRIIGVRENYYIICGDNRAIKEKVPYDWVIGIADSFFIGDEEIKVTDPRYIKYVKKVCRGYWSRKVKLIKNKIKKRLAL